MGGIAFVTFATRDGLQAAMKLHGALFTGRAIKVSEARGVGKREATGKGKGKGKGKAKDKDGKGSSKGKEWRRFESREFEVFVGGLPFSVSPDIIRRDFEDCGEIGRFHIPIDEEGGHTGTAFVNYLTKEGMEKALAFNDQEYGGVHIRVQKAAAPRSKGK